MRGSDRHKILLVGGLALLSAVTAVVVIGDVPARPLVPPTASLLGLLIVVLRSVSGTAAEDIKLTTYGLLLVLILAALFFIPLGPVSQPISGANKATPSSPRIEHAKSRSPKAERPASPVNPKGVRDK